MYTIEQEIALARTKLKGQEPKINVAQMPKNKEFLECLVARPGHVLIDSDITALEPTVLAELSGCPTYKEIFASGKPHDTYLYIARYLFPEQAEELDAVYNFDSPTKDSVKRAKTLFGKMRKHTKPVHLGGQYGASAYRMWMSLKKDGVLLPIEVVEDMHKKYWELFKTVKDYGWRLRDECWERGGYIINGLGRPIPIIERKQKDILNSMVQSTGHDILLILINEIHKEAEKRGVKMVAWVDDFHDQTTVEVEEKDVDIAKECFRMGYEKLNARIKGSIPIKGDIDVGTCMADFKEAY